jgi:hypothetical protein
VALISSAFFLQFFLRASEQLVRIKADYVQTSYIPISIMAQGLPIE